MPIMPTGCRMALVLYIYSEREVAAYQGCLPSHCSQTRIGPPVAWTEAHLARLEQQHPASKSLQSARDCVATFDRIKLFVKKPVTHVPNTTHGAIHLDTVVTAAPPLIALAGEAPSYSLSSCPSKV